MRRVNECDIVRDLLPNYIDKLTNDETNKFIEEHISNCDDCKNSLKQMDSTIEIKKPIKNKELNFLKRINTKFRVFGMIIILLIIAISAVSIYLYRTSIAYYPDGTKIGRERISKNEKYMYISFENEEESFKILASLNKEDKCTNIRVVRKALTDQALEDLILLYNHLEYTQNNPQIQDELYISLVTTNPEMIGDTLYYNETAYIGDHKNILINSTKKQADGYELTILYY